MKRFTIAILAAIIFGKLIGGFAVSAAEDSKIGQSKVSTEKAVAAM